MIRSKITRRLILYFSAALLLFSLLTGGAFTLLIARHTQDMTRAELQDRAETIADTMYGFLSGTATPTRGNGHGQNRQSGQSASPQHGSGFGAYLRFLGDIARTDVWVVDSNSMAITPGGEHSMAITYGELPQDGEAVIDRALTGEVCFSESFGDMLGTPTLSVGVPIRENGEAAPVGAVLLHTPVQGISDSIADGLQILLFSLIPALLLAIVAGALLSARFTRPLGRMKETAARLTEGDFSARNHFRQRDEIGELGLSMDRLSLRLQEAEEERGRLEQTRRDFLSNISHELRTPITVFRGSLEALTEGLVTEPAQVEEYHRHMLEESRQMQRLVDDLLELSRLENADFHIEKSPLALPLLLEDVARGTRRLAAPRGIHLETTGPSEELPFLGDYGRLRQMLLTVTGNAVKFSPEGGTILLSLQVQEGRPVFSVTDHGPGIPWEQLPEIFQRFRTTSSPENTSGTGLGLPIARQIALRHGIEIQVDSAPGETVFRFLFPEREK